MLPIFHISSLVVTVEEGTSRRAEVGSLGPTVKFVTLSGIQSPEFVYKSRCTCKFPDSRLEDVQGSSVPLTQEVADRHYKITGHYKALKAVRSSFR